VALMALFTGPQSCKIIVNLAQEDGLLTVLP
jgi:hypothetical protein